MMQKKMDETLMTVRRGSLENLQDFFYFAELLPDKGIRMGILTYRFPLVG
jgi:hypothetical protein